MPANVTVSNMGYVGDDTIDVDRDAVKGPCCGSQIHKISTHQSIASSRPRRPAHFLVLVLRSLSQHPCEAILNNSPVTEQLYWPFVYQLFSSSVLSLRRAVEIGC